MLSVAKHLLFLTENKQKQIPRSARDDIAGGFFSSLLDPASLSSLPFEMPRRLFSQGSMERPSGYELFVRRREVRSNEDSCPHVQYTTLIWLGLLLGSPGARLAAQDQPISDARNEESRRLAASRWNELADADTTGTSPALPGSSPLLYAPVRPQESATDHFHWGPALGETFFFTSFMHAKRILFDPDTAPEFGGPLFKDYFRSVAGLHGWDDHDPFQVQYIGHSFHGAVDERIEIQNNPKAWDLGWGAPGYWHSRLIGAAWATLWGAQFKIGPYSEAMIGNVGLPNQYRKRPLPPGANYGLMAWSEFVVNPVGGTAWVVTEDLLDRYVAQRMEGHVNRRFMCFARSFLTPSRSWANLLRFKKPWYRENRDIYGRPVASH